MSSDDGSDAFPGNTFDEAVEPELALGLPARKSLRALHLGHGLRINSNFDIAFDQT